MRNLVKAVLAAAVVLMIPGCGTVANQIAAIPDDQLAADLQQGASIIVSKGLAFAAKQAADKKDAILADAKVAQSVLATDILPALTGADVKTLTTGAAQDLLSRFSGKVSPTIVTAIQLAISAVAMQVPFPANPVDKLPERTAKALKGVFTGIDAGLSSYILQASAAPVTTARSAPDKLVWPVK